MKHDKKRITKIIDELINYFFSMGATDINLNLKEDPDAYRITFDCNYSCKDSSKLEKLDKYLHCEKQEEMEEYFWELTGDCDVDTELTLVGMMTDEASVQCVDDKLRIMLVRYKEQ